MRRQPLRSKDERRYTVTARVTVLGDGVYSIALDAPEDSPLAGASYKVVATNWREAAAKGMRYASETIAELNGALRGMLRGGAPAILDWQDAVLEGMS